jgi:pimeloyl-ACP methyl ester carboxylesterase
MSTHDHDVRLADGRVLRTRDRGAADGRPVFLLHGGLGSRLVLDPLSATAAAGLRLLSYDRPGFGGSTPQPGRTVADTAADVAAIADQLHLDGFAVWGESGGGPFALACAALLPDRVVAAAPGLYFLGLPFQYTPTSDHVGGVGRDARHIAQHLAGQSRLQAGHAASTPSRNVMT